MDQGHSQEGKVFFVRIRPVAIIIPSKGYVRGDNKKIKIDPNLKDLSGKASKIRRTQKGVLMFELKSPAKNSLG